MLSREESQREMDVGLQLWINWRGLLAAAATIHKGIRAPTKLHSNTCMVVCGAYVIVVPKVSSSDLHKVN